MLHEHFSYICGGLSNISSCGDVDADCVGVQLVRMMWMRSDCLRNVILL